METTWPGTWLLIAYIVFIGVGVLGSFAWAVAYQLRGSIAGRTEAKRIPIWLQIFLFEAGVLGATGMMAAIGYVGGSIVASGGSAVTASAAVAQNIIPPLSSNPTSVLNDMPPIVEALFIGVSLLAQLIGLLNLLTLKKEP